MGEKVNILKRVWAWMQDKFGTKAKYVLIGAIIIILGIIIAVIIAIVMNIKYILIGAGIIAPVIIVVIVLYKKFKKNNEEVETTA